MSVLHDLRCPDCETERENVVITASEFPRCTVCGTRMRWIPRAFQTDVRGDEQVSQVLVDPDNPHEPLRWRSSRERDQKMKRWGCEPAGDAVHGAVGLDSVPKARPVYSFGSDRERARDRSSEGARRRT